MIDGEDYTAKVVIGVKGDNKYYDHALTQIEKGTLIDNLNGLSNSVVENQNTSLMGKDSKLLSVLQTNSSKVVDENGEPMVVYHGEVGDISVVYGNDGYGLAHIAKKHPEVLNDLQGTIDGMVVTSQSDNRIVLESSTHRAVISKMLGNEPTSNWLLTAYEKKNPASASSSDIETEPEGKQNGTATLQNEISEGEDSENKSDMQEGGVNSPGIPVDAKGKKLYE